MFLDTISYVFGKHEILDSNHVRVQKFSTHLSTF